MIKLIPLDLLSHNMFLKKVKKNQFRYEIFKINIRKQFITKQFSQII